MINTSFSGNMCIVLPPTIRIINLCLLLSRRHDERRQGFRFFWLMTGNHDLLYFHLADNLYALEGHDIKGEIKKYIKTR